MTYLVERLKVLAIYLPEQASAFNEAANEIERLRSGIQAYIDGGYEFPRHDPAEYFKSLLDGKNE